MRISTTLIALAAALGFAISSEAASPTVLRDIPYAPALGEDGLGDLWLPEKAQPDGAASKAGAPPPVVLLIHGGGWSVGNRPSIAGIAQFFRDDLGFAVFNIEYRLASATNRWPACGDDCVAAANWLFTDDFRRLTGFSPDKIWLCGGSAGGHLALWTLVNLPPEKVAGCVSISSIGDPVPDFRAHRGRYTPLFGPVSEEATLAAMDPIPLIRPGMAPLLCTHADADEVVPIASHRAFADAYRAAGNRCDFFEYPHDVEPNKGGHFIWRPSPHRLLSVIEERIAAFVRDDRRQPLFAADFDCTARATISGGAPDPLPSSRNLDFVPGLRGQALHIPASADASLSYATRGNMNLRRGSASFWFRPDAAPPLFRML
ncbi:MAG: alpha/beta hydrolase [Kiritimatiellae bacterium]|nr:alpha/beta hydrolase [Kiritimatiellia bacterium]